MYRIGDISARTGVAEPTLRMWERRHGFPVATRTASGHRRYGETQLEQVRRVVAARAVGVPLAAAIERALAAADPASMSIFATVRRRCPEVPALLVSKRAMIALSRAIEDEVFARAERGAIFGSFQRERYYRQSEDRWHALAQGSAVAAAFADFEYTRISVGPDGIRGPVEIAIARDRPIARDWSIVYCSQATAICLAAREPPASNLDATTDERELEMVWTVDPVVVHELALTCAGAAGLEAQVTAILPTPPAISEGEQLLLAGAVFGRTLTQNPFPIG